MKKRLIFFLLVVSIFLVGCSNDEYTQTEDYESNSEYPDVEREIPKKEDSKNCENGKVIFDYPPVNLEKTELLVPLGLMTGGHVTPIDHQYFQNFDNDKPDIEVYSPGEGFVTSIQHMFGERYENDELIEWIDFRLEIQHTCSISSIYIHIDVLSDKLLMKAPKKGEYSSIKVPVEAGEVIGWYQNNVDYNLVDQDVVLQGLLIPEHYEREIWKIHVPNTLEYFNEEIKNKLIEKSIRTYEPISGKLDYDIDGKLIGNWFEENTNWYGGNTQERYWKTHLSISPNYLDPNHIIVSMGDYDGREEQFGVRGNKPNPAEVSVSSGLVKYELVNYGFYTLEGEIWDRTTLAKIKESKNYDFVQGVILLELIEDRKLKVEIFPGKEGSEVNGFSNGVKVYER